MATVYERLKKILVKILGVKEEEITPSAKLADDLGADSLTRMIKASEVNKN